MSGHDREFFEERMVDEALRDRAAPDLGEAILAAAARRASGREETPPAPVVVRRGGRVFRRAWYLAACVAALLLVPALCTWAIRAWQRHDLLTSRVHLLVSAPPAVPDGSPLRFHVETRDLARAALRADIHWKVLDAEGNTVQEAVATCDGSADFTAASTLHKIRKLVVTATVPGSGFSKTLEQAIHPAQAAPLVHVTSDKPAYRPGETVLLRVACLDRLTLRGTEAAGLRCRIVDPRGGKVAENLLAIGRGVGAWTWPVPAEAAGGRYALEVRDQKDTFTLERLEFLVRNFQPPRLQKRITLDRQTYAAGARGTAEVAATRASGGAAAGAKVHATLVVDGEEAWQEDGVLDGNGRAAFRFAVPGSVRHGAARLVARIDDGGTVETWIEPFVVPTDKVEVALYPEGGDLVAGHENRVYAQVRDALGRPLSGTGEIVDDKGAVVAPFATQHMGRARVAFTPVAGRRYSLRLLAPREQTVDLPAVQDTGVVLRPEGDFIAAGAPARCQVFAAGQGPWIAAVFCRGVLVGQQSVLTSGAHDVEVALAPEASGVLRLTVFDRALRPVAERLVTRDAKRSLVVELKPSKDRVTPGGKQTVKVRTTDETGAPVSCIVGLSVSDRAVADMTDFVRTGLDDQRQLWTDVEKPDDKAEEFLAAHAEYRRNVDLLLGSLGWRRYVWRGDADETALVAAGGAWAKALPLREGRAFGPRVRENLGEYRAEVVAADASWAKARTWVVGFGVFAALLAVVLAALHALARALRRFEWRVPIGAWTAATGVVLLSLPAALLAGLWLVPSETRSLSSLFETDRQLVATLKLFTTDSEGPETRPMLDVVDGGSMIYKKTSYFTSEPIPEVVFGALDSIEVAQALDKILTISANDALADPAGVNRFLPLPRFAPPPGFETAPAPKFIWRDESGMGGQRGEVGGEVSPPFGFTHFVSRFVDRDEDGLPDSRLPDFESPYPGIAAGVRFTKVVDNLNQIPPPPGMSARERDVLRGIIAAHHPELLRSGTGAPTRPSPAVLHHLRNVLGNPALNEFVVRYAHQQATGRRDFRETLYWRPYLVTDAEGEATIDFDVSDSVTTWQVHADAHGGGRVGQATVGFASYLPFSLEPKVPTRVTEGDVLRLPVSVVADDATATGAQVALQANGPVTMKTTGDHNVTLKGGRGRALAELTFGKPEGEGAAAALAIQGRLGTATDVTTRQLVVVPRGFPRREDRAGTLAGTRDLTLQLPDDELARRTAVLRLRFFPSPFADLEQAVDGMLQEPHGCFEQVSSTNYPNVLALRLLRTSGDDVPAIARRAHELLAKGYAQLVAYEVKGGGFEWWGKDPAHATLTAYGLLQFADMAGVFDVDPAMVQRTRAWLLSKRDGKGGFVTGEGRYGHFMGGTAQARDAYIDYALLASGHPAGELRGELDALCRRAADTDNAYELAVAACALDLAQRPEARAARARLAGMQHEDGALRGTGSITGSGPEDLAVETTAFAVLAWLGHAAQDDAVGRAVRFLQGSRQGAGTFGGTQATVMALRALTAWLASDAASRKPGTLHVLLGGEEVCAQDLLGTEKRTIELSDLGRRLVAGANALRLELSGGGTLPFALELTYRADQPAGDPTCALDLRTWLGTTTLDEGASTALHCVVRNKTGAPVANPMVIAGLPAGLHVDARVLDDLKKADTIASWELRDNAVILYLRGLEAGEARDVVIDLTARIPGVTRGDASRAYLYYSARQKAWAAPLEVEVTAGR